MSNLNSTLEILLALGFEDRPPEIRVKHATRWMVPQGHRFPSVSVCYGFTEFDLVASPTLNSFNVPVIELTGYREDRRSLSIIQGQIPINLGTPLEAAAWISFVLESDKRHLDPLPDWFVEGEGHWDLVPPARELPAARAREEAYQASPKCSIDRDYARPIRRNLMEEISWLREGESADTKFTFDGRILTIDFGDSVHEVVASGDSWPNSYCANLTPESKFPAKFERQWVEVSAFEGYICVDRFRLGPCQAVA